MLLLLACICLLLWGNNIEFCLLTVTKVVKILIMVEVLVKDGLIFGLHMIVLALAYDEVKFLKLRDDDKQ